jgi:hypothetical protein
MTRNGKNLYRSIEGSRSTMKHEAFKRQAEGQSLFDLQVEKEVFPVSYRAGIDGKDLRAR